MALVVSLLWFHKVKIKVPGSWDLGRSRKMHCFQIHSIIGRIQFLVVAELRSRALLSPEGHLQCLEATHIPWLPLSSKSASYWWVSASHTLTLSDLTSWVISTTTIRKKEDLLLTQQPLSSWKMVTAQPMTGHYTQLPVLSDGLCLQQPLWNRMDFYAQLLEFLIYICLCGN